MADYRVYRINAQGRVASAEWVSAPSDSAALKNAHELCDERHPSVEVWRGAERLGLIPCNTQDA